MNLTEHYKKLLLASVEKIERDDYVVDTLIDDAADKRFGLTLRVVPSDKVKDKVQEFLSDLRAVEPNQYMYPSSDIHVTVMSIISCYQGFDFSKIDLSRYIDLIDKCLSENTGFNIRFKGLTAANSCIMLQGFTNNDNLNDIRGKLRTEFNDSDLEQSLDKRYAIQTAHSTIVRLRKNLENKREFLQVITQYANSDFGSFEVKQIELVYNDWYHRNRIVKKLHVFDI